MGRHTAPSLGPCRRAKRSTNGTGRSYVSVHLTVSEFDQVRHGATARGSVVVSMGNRQVVVPDHDV